MEKLSLEELKKVELDILIWFADICEQEKLNYTLSYGTLLGAVRHKGFIPWDDDIDVAMPRPDYEKFIEYCNTHETHYKLIDIHNDKGYNYLFAKVYDPNTTIVEKYANRFKANYGVYIDIFSLERIPFSLAWIAGHMQGQIYNQLNNQSLKQETMLRRIRLIYRFNSKIGFPILRFLAKFIPGKKLRHSFGTAYFKPRYLEDIFPLSEMEFEGKKFPVPHNTDALLRKIYGDYMKLPDLDSIHPHYSKLEIYK